MTDNHPITPSPELVVQWRNQAPEGRGSQTREMWIATQSARWGADMELEACCEWLGSIWPVVNVPIDELRTARRPKPPSLKEQALTALSEADQGLNESEWQQRSDTIRRALEQLDD